MRKQLLTYQEFEEIYSRVPRLCVDLLVRNGNGIVLTKRTHASWRGKWNMPGGQVLYREKVVDAVERILREELGVKGDVAKQLGYLEYFSEVQERGFGYSISLVFECEIRGELPEKNEDGEEIRIWRKVPDNVIEEQQKMIAEALRL